MVIDKKSKIYIAGHKGLVGNAILDCLKSDGYNNLIVASHDELDLTNQKQTRDFFDTNSPDYVFLAAAFVGGINANNRYPAEFYYINTMIQCNVIHCAFLNNVKRLLFLGSSCIYPKYCPQPIKEEYLLSGHLEPTNRPYAIAKIAGIEQCFSYNRQYGTKYTAVMPTNLYGPGDNYDLDKSHVIPAMVHKMHLSKINGDKSVMLWGTGTPKREFLFNKDLASACVFIMNLAESKYDSIVDSEDYAPVVNIGSSKEISIDELAKLVAKVVGFEGEILWDNTMPDGTPRKLMNSSRICDLGWQPEISLEEGLRIAYKDFLKRAI